MKKSFLIPTVVDRFEDCKEMLKSIKNYLSTDWNLYMTFQGHNEEQLKEITDLAKNLCKNDFQYLYYDHLIGTHSARIVLLEHFDSDVWCTIDDDIRAMDKFTHYNEMAEFLWRHTSLGMLGSIMVEDTEEYHNFLKVTPLIDYAKPQKIVLTDGGLMFKNEVVPYLLNIPNVDYLCDNTMWSITCYVNGYTNAQYFGSASLHLFELPGGRKEYIAKDPNKYQPPKEFVDYDLATSIKPLNGTFTSEMVTAEADELYNKNRKF